MTIKVIKLEDACPSGNYGSPGKRAVLLGYAGADFLAAVTFLVQDHETVGPLFNVTLPMMHQTIELLSKALAYTADPNFNPKKYSHRVVDLLREYAASVPVFTSMLADDKTVVMLQGLEKSYFGVRYGECALMYDGDDWTLFSTWADELLDELRNRTGLRFPVF